MLVGQEKFVGTGAWAYIVETTKYSRMNHIDIFII